MKMLLTTEEGFPKDKTPKSKKKFNDGKTFLTFSGNDAPLKMVKTLMKKYGISRDQIGDNP